MGSIAENPPDAEKFLFAADVVSYFLNDRYPALLSEFNKTDLWRKSNLYREHVQQRFSENIKKMITVIHETQSVLVRKDFLEIKNQDRISIESLLEYNSLFKDCHFAKGFEARNFLMYCARIAVMGCHFFAQGMEHAPDIAVDLIKSAFTDDKDEDSLIWPSLENAALNYATVKSDFSGSVAPFLFRRDPTEMISSETEESSTSSTNNSETESVAEMQNLTSTSSTDSLSVAGVKMDVSSSESQDVTKSETEESTSVSESNVSDLSESPSTSQIKECIISDIEKRIRDAFLKAEGIAESSTSTSSVANLVEPSGRKSCLGKRPSPRKERLSSAFLDAESTQHIDETEIKKRKQDSPKNSD